MKHQLPGSVKGPTPKGIATCASCGLKAKRVGKLGLPAGCIGIDNPLFGGPWSIEACSDKCAATARINAVMDYLEKSCSHT